MAAQTREEQGVAISLGPEQGSLPGGSLLRVFKHAVAAEIREERGSAEWQGRNRITVSHPSDRTSNMADTKIRSRRRSLALANSRLASHSLSQAGIFSRDQALRSGFTRSQIQRRLEIGEWSIVLPSIYRYSGDPLTFEGEIFAAVLWAGPGTVASHRSAARLWGLPGFESAGPEVTVPGHQRVCERVTVHRSSVARHEVVRRGRLRLTSVARTILDLAGETSDEALEAIIDFAVVRGLVTRSRLIAILEQRCAKGRGGAVPDSRD